MLVFHALCYSEEAARTPFYSPLFSSVAQASGPTAYRKLMWDLLSHSQVCVASYRLEMSFGSVGALIEFVSYKVTLRSCLLTGSIILGGQLENPAANF